MTDTVGERNETLKTIETENENTPTISGTRETHPPPATAASGTQESSLLEKQQESDMKLKEPETETTITEMAESQQENGTPLEEVQLKTDIGSDSQAKEKSDGQEKEASSPLEVETSDEKHSPEVSNSDPLALLKDANPTSTTLSPLEEDIAVEDPLSKATAETEKKDENDADVASKAAVALAAVAAAAVANNKSPAEAAREARIVAQSFIKSEVDSTKREFQQVSLVGVTTLLEGTVVPANEALVEYLLLMEYFLADTAHDNFEQLNEQERAKATEAAEATVQLWKKMDLAYESLQGMLPPVAEDDDENVLPDLLPCCAVKGGDQTISFFRSCRGETLEPVAVPDEAIGRSNSVDDADFLEQPSTSTPPPSPGTQSASVFNMFRRSPARGSILNSFRRPRNESSSQTDKAMSSSSERTSESTTPGSPLPPHQPGDYGVTIEREMLGLTVENVLERTVVRTVLPTGPAKKAGAKVGSLIVQVGNAETKTLTHFETIDELRQSQRPLQLVLRQVTPDSLRMAREEMGRLIKGSGFGTIMDSGPNEAPKEKEAEKEGPLIGADLIVDAYTNLVRRRFAEVTPQARNKKEEALGRAGEKLAWILTLFVVGLEKEDQTASTSKSVAKVLLEYARKKLDKTRNGATSQMAQSSDSGKQQRRWKGKRNPTQRKDGDKPLLQIGDVLQRTRTFLADTKSRPAAILRGEVIGFLCDLLDIDSDMELSDEDAGSAHGGPINDLGSAGSLLKLIILNCPLMMSPGCASASSDEEDPELLEELFQKSADTLSAMERHRLHAGNRFLAVVHRLAASRSTSARITACSLGPVIWGHLDFPHQLQLRGVVTRALHDVEVMVRKATATVLHEIAELVFDSRCVPWLVLMCERAMTDPEPQMRSAAMTLTWHLAEHLPNAFLGDASQGSAYLQRLPDRNDPIFADVYLLQCKLLPVATRLAEDRSPSVRLAVAAQCDRLCFALGDHWSSVVIDALLALLSDSDERVRCEAVMCVPRLSEIVLLSHAPGETAASELSILEALIPASIKLQRDPSASVRVSLASAAGDLLTLLVGLQRRVAEPGDNQENQNFMKYKRQVDDRLIPLVQDLLNDTDPEVTSGALRAVTNASRKSVTHQPRMREMSIASEDDSLSVTSYHSQASRDARQPVFLPVLSEVQVMRLLPTLTELASSKQWRVRQSAVEIVPALLGCTQRLKTRSEISKLCLSLMNDSVDAVRRTAAECLCMGGSSLGSHGEEASAEWTTSIVIPAIRKCAVHKASKHRILSLKMVEIVILNGACPSKWSSEGDSERMTDSPMRELATIALSLTSDRIANVRLNIGRVLEEVLHEFEEPEIRFIREILLQQVQEEQFRSGGGDADVLFFANRCIERADHILSTTVVLGEERTSALTS